MRLKFYADDNSDKENEKEPSLPVTSGLQKGMDDKGYYYFREVENNGTYDTVFLKTEAATGQRSAQK